MNDCFNSLLWHDSELLEIHIDRRRPGHVDDVRIEVSWSDGTRSVIVFSSCYAMTADMNFGIIAEERILAGSESKDDPGLEAIKRKWAPLGVSLEGLRCFRIETASTGSVLKIYAMHCAVQSASSSFGPA
jgi:hypothetical protein